MSQTLKLVSYKFEYSKRGANQSGRIFGETYINYQMIRIGLLIFLLSISALKAYAEPTLSCLPAARLCCPMVESFIRQYIVPMYKNNNGDKDHDRIYVKFVKGDHIDAVQVTVYLHDISPIEDYEHSGYNYYSTIIDDVRVILVSSRNNPYVKPIDAPPICFKSNTLFGTNDNCASWMFILKDDWLEYKELWNWGLRWIKDLPKSSYIPNYTRIIPIEDRDSISPITIESASITNLKPPKIIDITDILVYYYQLQKKQ